MLSAINCRRTFRFLRLRQFNELVHTLDQAGASCGLSKSLAEMAVSNSGAASVPTKVICREREQTFVWSNATKDWRVSHRIESPPALSGLSGTTGTRLQSKPDLQLGGELHLSMDIDYMMPPCVVFDPSTSAAQTEASLPRSSCAAKLSG